MQGRSNLVSYSMLLDIEFFKSNLGTMEGFGDAGDYLTVIVQVKQSKIVAPAASAEAENKKNRRGCERGKRNNNGNSASS